MATTTKVIVQIHERTTYVQLTTDLQLRELGYESTNDSFNFNNNADTNLTIWAKESTGVSFDNAVGIGTLPQNAQLHIKDGSSGATPSSVADGLHIEGSGATGLTISAPSTSNTQILFADETDVSACKWQWIGASNNMIIGPSTTGGNLSITSGDAVTAITIDSSQNVGIGESSPGYALEVDGGGDTVIGKFKSTDASAFVAIEDSTTTTDALRIGAVGNDMRFVTSASTRMTIDSTGNVGVNAGDLNVDLGGLTVVTTGEKVRVGTSDGYGEFYGSGSSTVLNTTTDDLLLAVEGTTKVTVGPSDVTIGSEVALITAASSGTISGFRLPHGTAPSAPVNGDFWTTTTGVFARVSGDTYQMPVVTAGGATIDLDQAASATDTTWYWTKSDDQVTITPVANASATSTATTNFTLSGIPANLRPTTVSVTVYIHVFNDTAKEFAKMVIQTDGTATISRWDGSDFSSTSFTTSSLRGLYSMPAFTYKIL